MNKVRQQNNVKLYNYWNSLRGDNQAPHRFEIDPSKISSVLSETFILENELVGRYQFRLAGTKICRQFGRELKHTDILELWDKKDREALENLLVCTTHDAAVGVGDFIAVAKNGQTVEYEMLLLPLMHHDFAITRVLGTMIATSEPYWLGISAFESFRLKAVRLFWPDDNKEFGEKYQQVHHSNVTPLHKPDYKIVTAKDRRFKVYEGGRDNSPEK